MRLRDISLQVIWEHLLPPPCRLKLEALAVQPPFTPGQGLFPLSVTEERYGLGNGNDLYLLSELRALHHPSLAYASSPVWHGGIIAPISRLFIIAASCLWVIYVYRYQIAVGWPALNASGELSLRELFSDGAFIRHWFYLLSAAALGGALGVIFDDTPRRNFFESEIAIP